MHGYKPRSSARRRGAGEKVGGGAFKAIPGRAPGIDKRRYDEPPLPKGMKGMGRGEKEGEIKEGVKRGARASELRSGGPSFFNKVERAAAARRFSFEFLKSVSATLPSAAAV